MKLTLDGTKDIVNKMKKRVIQIDKGIIIRDDKKGGYSVE